jgi:hypothetical protein
MLPPPNCTGTARGAVRLGRQDGLWTVASAWWEKFGEDPQGPLPRLHESKCFVPQNRRHENAGVLLLLDCVGMGMVQSAAEQKL